MSNPALIKDKNKVYPVLIVDRQGFIGKALAEKLKEDSLVVLVTSLKLDFSENIIHIPYLKKFPTIPDNIYSHIFIVDEVPTFFKEIFNEFLNKAKDDNSDLVAIFHLANKENALIDKILSYKRSKIILYRDVFGENSLDRNSYVNKFIIQIKTSGKIEMPSSGLKTVYPILFDDLINGILEVSFESQSKEQIINIFPKQGITLISLVRIFQKIDPSIKIIFSDSDKEEKELNIEEKGIYFLGEKYPLEEKLKKIELDGNRTYIETKKKSANRSIFTKIINFRIILAILIIIFLLPVVSTLSFYYFGNLLLNSFEQKVITNNFNSSKTDLYFTNTFFEFTKVSLPLFSIEANLLGQSGIVNKINTNVNSGSDMSNMFLGLTNFVDNFKNGNNFLSAINNLKQATYLYEQQKSENNISSNLANRIDGLISFASKTESAFPQLLSINGNKSYLILFSDNNNLSPNGGIISCYGLLKIQNGKVIDFSVHNIDEADSLLKLRIEPPYPLRRYMSITNWYLKNSNFDPDFSKSAVASAMIFNTEENQKVDGVIMADLYFAKNLLSLVGPINITNYNLTVDQDNVIAKVADNATILKDNKNFINALFESIFNEISQKNISEFSLFNIFLKSVNEKHIVFAFNDVSTQETFSANDFSSTIEETRPNIQNLINDFLGISEANLGGNEIGDSITRNVSEEVVIGNNGSLSSSLNITYNNTSSNENYKNYLRIILPKGSTLSSISIDNQNQKIIQAITDPAIYGNKNFKAPLGLEVNTEDEQDKVVFGFLVNIPEGQQKTIQISYQNSLIVPVNLETFTYSLRVFKQPGIDSYPLTLSVSYPNNFDFQVTQNFMKQGNQAIDNETILQDKDLNLTLNKK